MQPPVTTPTATASPSIASTCPLCEQRAGAFIADHRGLPRHQLRNGYVCDCVGRVTVPVEEDFLLRNKDKAHRLAVARAVRRRWEQGVTVNLDRETFRRLLLEEAVA
jgi:hypothetical protein